MQLEDRFYTSTEVAEILGVSLRSVYRYMEDNKLIAEVKTATGRHRFTRKNIVDFLYPDGEGSPLLVSEEKRTNINIPTPAVQPSQQAAPAQEQPQSEPVQDVQEDNEGQVDWLAKFREAATKYKEEQTQEGDMSSPTAQDPNLQMPSQQQEQVQQAPVQTQQIPEQPQQVQQPQQVPVPPQPQVQAQPQQQVQTPNYEYQTQSFSQQTVVTPSVPPQTQAPASTSPNLMYYRSMLGGLKDIAQNLDKSARNSNLEYAFTLNAGASLHKPIKPFATLHAYVKSQDRDFYEKILRLTPSNQSNAQLCLVVSDNQSIYANRAEVHGLFVVAKEQLRTDIASFGDSQLAQEMADVL